VKKKLKGKPRKVSDLGKNWLKASPKDKGLKNKLYRRGLISRSEMLNNYDMHSYATYAWILEKTK